MYFPWESANQIHCYMTRQGLPGDAEAVSKLLHLHDASMMMMILWVTHGYYATGYQIGSQNLHNREAYWSVPGDAIKYTIPRSA